MKLLYTLFILTLIIVCTPITLLIMLGIVCMSGLPIFFRQKRIGKNGIPFTIYKFRTMRAGAQRDQVRFRHQNESDGPTFKLYNDPRFTPIGKFLAHTGLDELPQFWNVLRGDMALLGPRPLPVSEVAKLKRWQHKRHTIAPGIISPAILTGRYHEIFDAWMKSDIAYTKEKNFWGDLRLTARAVRFFVSMFLREITRVIS